jgi:hypothetical protein
VNVVNSFVLFLFLERPKRQKPSLKHSKLIHD